MDGDGWIEIIVVWQMGSDLQMLDIYSMKGFVASSIATTDYTEYTTANLDGDDKTELFVIRHVGEAKTGEVELYYINADGETESAQAPLSNGMEKISKLATGKLRDGSDALFVEGSYEENGLVTDIFVAQNGELRNSTLSSRTGLSESTVRQYTVYCRDVDNDGIMEVPVPRLLNSKSDTVYRVLDWYSFNKWGSRSRKLTTYHNYSDGWYLVLPEDWGDRHNYTQGGYRCRRKSRGILRMERYGQAGDRLSCYIFHKRRKQGRYGFQGRTSRPLQEQRGHLCGQDPAFEE
jgi:hypothetical protein